MTKQSNTKTYTVAELQAMSARGEDKTDFARIDAMSEADLEAAIASDEDWKDVPADWFKDAVAVRGQKEMISIRVDPDVLAWFRSSGRGWQTKANAVLRAYMEAVNKAR